MPSLVGIGPVVLEEKIFEMLAIWLKSDPLICYRYTRIWRNPIEGHLLVTLCSNKDLILIRLKCWQFFFLILSPFWKRVWSFIWIDLNQHHLKMLCAKFGWLVLEILKVVCIFFPWKRVWPHTLEWTIYNEFGRGLQVVTKQYHFQYNLAERHGPLFDIP